MEQVRASLQELTSSPEADRAGSNSRWRWSRSPGVRQSTPLTGSASFVSRTPRLSEAKQNPKRRGRRCPVMARHHHEAIAPLESDEDTTPVTKKRAGRPIMATTPSPPCTAKTSSGLTGSNGPNTLQQRHTTTPSGGADKQGDWDSFSVLLSSPDCGDNATWQSSAVKAKCNAAEETLCPTPPGSKAELPPGNAVSSPPAVDQGSSERMPLRDIEVDCRDENRVFEEKEVISESAVAFFKSPCSHDYRLGLSPDSMDRHTPVRHFIKGLEGRAALAAWQEDSSPHQSPDKKSDFSPPPAYKFHSPIQKTPRQRRCAAMLSFPERTATHAEAADLQLPPSPKRARSEPPATSLSNKENRAQGGLPTIDDLVPRKCRSPLVDATFSPGDSSLFTAHTESPFRSSSKSMQQEARRLSLDIRSPVVRDFVSEANSFFAEEAEDTAIARNFLEDVKDIAKTLCALSPQDPVALRYVTASSTTSASDSCSPPPRQRLLTLHCSTQTERARPTALERATETELAFLVDAGTSPTRPQARDPRYELPEDCEDEPAAVLEQPLDNEAQPEPQQQCHVAEDQPPANEEDEPALSPCEEEHLRLMLGRLSLDRSRDDPMEWFGRLGEADVALIRRLSNSDRRLQRSPRASVLSWPVLGGAMLVALPVLVPTVVFWKGCSWVWAYLTGADWAGVPCRRAPALPPPRGRG